MLTDEELRAWRGSRLDADDLERVWAHIEEQGAALKGLQAHIVETKTATDLRAELLIGAADELATEAMAAEAEVRRLREALEGLTCDDTCAIGYESTNPLAHDNHCPRRVALEALAPMDDPAPKGKDEGTP
jgi:hypothetical protein